MRSFKFFRMASMVIGMSLIYQSCTKTDIPIPWPGHNPGGGQGSADNAMVLYWNDKAATVLSIPMRQPDRSRYFAMIEIAVHDALNNIKPEYERYSLNEPTKWASPDAAVASAAYWTIKGLDLQGDLPLDAWYDSSLASISNSPAKEAGKTLGKHAAEAIIGNRANDGFTEVISASMEPADGTTPGVYRQTNMIPFRVIPNWGIVMKPYIVVNNEQFRPEGPYDVKSAEYAKDYNEVKKKGARDGSTRTAEETKLALFWSDNRISIIWNDFAYRIIASKKMDAWETARFFAVLHAALGDGFNSVLEAKYHFYYWRPETAIHEGDRDGNTGTVGDANWNPFTIEVIQPTPPGNWVSPPVPEYPSSYAMAGGVTAEVIRRTLDTDNIYLDFTSISLPGTTLHYNSLAKAARDNSLGKMYGGWYFRNAVLDGEDMGKNIAAYVSTHGFKKE